MSGWPAMGSGVVAENGIGQSDFMHFLRGLQPLYNIFSAIWKTPRLSVSFDGCGVFRPPEWTPAWRQSPKRWYHVDQNPYRLGLACYQGLMNLKESGPLDGGLIVVPGSHKNHDNLRDNLNLPHTPTLSQKMKDFCKLPPEYVNQFGNGLKLCLKPGDFVVWDSRTIHCNEPPHSLYTHSHTDVSCFDLRRLVAYITMSPLSLSLPHVIHSRKQAVTDGVTTTHWPHFFQPSAAPHPPGYTPSTILLNDPHRRRLASLDPWPDSYTDQLTYTPVD
eukprot:TRINITY_DN7237_c1_g1_i2.p1 TRINITY_DN7237_c1_g1~~TRINITY_DN7237_c1_g1_i2.p1  ORF type:complete len:275 (-),score=42.07 TRINITY_DN7237_c1_g1_i2:78-902(-)